MREYDGEDCDWTDGETWDEGEDDRNVSLAEPTSNAWKFDYMLVSYYWPRARAIKSFRGFIGQSCLPKSTTAPSFTLNHLANLA
jgi:hypothetical protein